MGGTCPYVSPILFYPRFDFVDNFLYIRSMKRLQSRLKFNDIHPRTFVEQMNNKDNTFSIEFRYWFKSDMLYAALNRKLNYHLGQRVFRFGNNSFCFVQVPRAINEFPLKEHYLELSWILIHNESIPIKKNKEFIRELVLELDEFVKSFEFITIEDR